LPVRNTVTAPIKIVSSMATRQALAELAAAYEARAAQPVELVSLGGVEAAKRVRAGEAFDVVVLASDALDKLAAEGFVFEGTRVDVARSDIGVAVRSGAARPDVGSEDALRRAVQDACSVGYSTGPSGTYLVELFERWRIADAIRERIVQAPPGVPVGTLVARGEVEIGFQQLSELVHVDGIDVLGTLPEAVRFITTFSGGVTKACDRPDAARALLAFLASPAAADVLQRQGMEPAAFEKAMPKRHS
jgi:molybdate transport system substrate-binding protein